MADDDLDIEVHWFCFTFRGHSLTGRGSGGNQYIEYYKGYSEKKIPHKSIMTNKKEAGLYPSSVLMACSYLGYMSKREFIDAK